MQQPGESTPRVSVSDITPTTVAGSRFGYQLTVTVVGEAAGVLDASRAAIQGQGGSVEIDTPPVLVANFGSMAMTRMFGAIFVPGRTLPVKLVCEQLPGEQPALRLTTSEGFGFGTLFGVEGRFRKRCQAVLNEVSGDLRARLEPGHVA